MPMNNFWIEKFKNEALPKLIHDFKPETILLFGSHVKATANEDSDIDVIIVSKAFSNIPFLKRMPMILKKVRFEKHIDYICYSPKEFQKIKNRSSVVMDALEYGEYMEV